MNIGRRGAFARGRLWSCLRVFESQKIVIQSTPLQAPQRLNNVQALRGIAALFVFAAHIKGAESEYSAVSTLLPQWMYMGVTGVDLFFLISGFVMVHVSDGLAAGTRFSAQFLYNRAARIYPLYWLVTISLIVLYAGKKLFFGEDTPIPNYLSSFLLTPSVHYPVLPVGWTLVHEMYFYVIFAGIILAPKRLWPLLLALWGVAVAAGSVSGVFGLNAWTKIAFNPLTAEFLIGAGLAFIVRRGVTGFALPALLAGTIWLAILFFGFTSLYPETMGDFAKRALLFAPPYALILYGAVALERRASRDTGSVAGSVAGSRVQAPRWLIYAGDASYALYLVHVPVFLVVGKTVSSLIADGPLVDNLALIAGYTLGGLIVAVLAHEVSEKPMLSVTRKLGARLFNRTRAPGIRPERAW